MPSKTSLISSGVLTGMRIARVACCESVASAPSVSAASSSSTFHSGFHVADGFFSTQVAKPSFSQMSSHHFIVTRSPNHWCASSCPITDAISLRVPREARVSSASRRVSRNVMAPEFSIAPAEKSGIPMMSSLPNGYLMPK